MFKSIFGRLFWTYTLIIVVIFISISVTTAFIFDSYIQSRQETDVFSAGESLEKMTGIYQIEETDIRARNAYKQSIINWAHFLHGDIIVVNSNGKISETTGKIDTVPQEYLNEVIEGKIVKEKGHFGGQYEERVLTIGLPVRYRGSIVGGMFFNTYLPRLRRSLTEMFVIFFISVSVTLVIAFILIYIQSKRISKPIGQINAAARDIAAGNPVQHIEVRSNDEIGQLASTFNFMAKSVEKLEKQSSGFVSDVSHELRTPMTSITGFIQGILDGTIPEEKREYYLNIVLEESVRLTKLVNDLLDMSKITSSEYQLNITSFDLNELIRICIIGLGARIDEKNLELNVDFETDNLMVMADKDAMKRVIINLLDNALKFSYPNTTMGISTWTKNKKAYVCIGNFGDGIPGEDLSNIFNRFYKADKSRTNNKSGAGLGLSFVKSILTLHKQSIWVESVDTKEGSDAKYTKFTFTLETV